MTTITMPVGETLAIEIHGRSYVCTNTDVRCARCGRTDRWAADEAGEFCCARCANDGGVRITLVQSMEVWQVGLFIEGRD